MSKELSKCHNVPVVLCEGNEWDIDQRFTRLGATYYYGCTECHKACDVAGSQGEALPNTSPNTESDKSIDEYLKPFHQTGCPFSKKYGKCVNADCEHKIRDLKSNLYSLLMDVIGEDDIQKPNDEDYQEWLVCDTCEVIIDPELKTYECNCKLLNNLRQTQRTKLKELFNVKEK